jgi:hypothetical protein
LTSAAAALLLINRVSQGESGTHKLRISCSELLSGCACLSGNPQAAYGLAHLIKRNVVLLERTNNIRPKHVSDLTPVGEVHAAKLVLVRVTKSVCHINSPLPR